MAATVSTEDRWTRQPAPQAPPGRLDGLDYGRAFFAIAVVAWHAAAFGVAGVLERPATFDLTGALYMNVLVLAVPFFLLTSLFLYARTWSADAARLRRRLTVLVAMTAFWVAVTQMVRGIGDIGRQGALEFVLTGGHTVYYFLVELIVLTLVVEGLARAGLRGRVGPLAGLTAAGIALMLLREPLADLLPRSDELLLAYWSPLGFLVYAPAALLLVALVDRGVSVRWLGAGALAYVAVAAVEWLVLLGAPVGGDRPGLPNYARPSLVLGAMLVVAALTLVRTTPPRVVVWLSGLSLGIYVTHRLVLDNLQGIWPGLWARVDEAPFAVFLIVLAVSTALTWTARTQRVL